MPGFRFLACALLCFCTAASAQKSDALRQRIQQIASRPALKNAHFGVKVYDITTGNTLAAINEDKLFSSGSTTKVVTMGTALALLGSDFRFHTRIYRTGPLSTNGVLNGNLVLVASGDPNLSARVWPNDTLAYTSADHAYAGALYGKAVPGDPLLVLKQIATRLKAAGVTRIRGSVLVDASLFPSDKSDVGTGTAISPIVVNDNIIDVTVTPSQQAGGPTSLLITPLVPYLRIVNKTVTGAPDSDPELLFTSDTLQPDGTHVAVLEGNVPAGWESSLAAYKVKEPVRFAEMALTAALQSVGIAVENVLSTQPLQLPARSAYTAENFLVEHVSPPFREEVKVTLKASQNLHASLVPYILGTTLAPSSSSPLQEGFNLEQQFLQKAALGPETVSQLDGAGGIGAAFSPNFIVRYLTFITRQPYGKYLIDALPVMGRDGTLAETEKDSPAAGHVHAKTGSYIVFNALNRGVLTVAKGLVGYIDAPNGHRLAFAAYFNLIPGHNMEEAETVGDALAEIATAAYESTRVKSPAISGKKPSKPAPSADKKPSVHR